MRRFAFVAAIQRRWGSRVVWALGQWRQGQAHSRQVDVDKVASEYIRADQTIFVADGVLVADEHNAILERQLANVDAVGQGQVATLRPFVVEATVVRRRNACQFRSFAYLAAD